MASGNLRARFFETPLDQVPEVEDEARFDFVKEMRITRLWVDSLLAAGDVEGAESYMEERRKLFVENGYLIRKLNQAYFAFHGTYGTSPSSVSPIAGQLTEYRELVPDLGDFMSRVAGFSSYEQFLEDLASLKTQVS